MIKIIFKNLAYFIIFILALISCNKNNLVFDDDVKSFVWKAMNSWYNWQDSVTNLSDSKIENTDDFNNFIGNYNTPQALFEDLKHSEDDFSWFIEDYVAQQESFQGITTSFGFTPSLIRISGTDLVIMYIQYVSDNSPADTSGFKRGDIINAIDGTIMTIQNYNTVLEGYYENTASFGFTQNDGITFKEEKEITRSIVSDNPVYLTKTFDNVNGKKVGYLVYNGFRTSYNDELNDAFAQFKTAAIEELIIDLRLNGGGSLLTSAFLASMIYDQADDSTTFGELKYNSKHTDSNSTVPFFDKLFIYDEAGNYTGVQQDINRLSGITKLYILTSGNTASASEMIINGLRPFIDVKTVGTTTTGKNEGSVTLYDSPSSDYRNSDTANPAHTMAMQPIVFQIYNILGQSDYNEGFEPNLFVQESDYWNAILPFGDENEIVLKTALDDIRGVSSKSFDILIPSELINSEISKDKFAKEMYLESTFFR